MKKLLLIASVLALTSNASAGNEGGGGGRGKVINGVPYLLDLVEEGIEQQSYRITTMNKNILAEVKKFDAKFPMKDSAILAGVLSELKQFAQKETLTQILAMRTYRFVLVNSSLVQIKDYNTTIDCKGCVQLAVRKGDTIRIDKNLWPKLGPANQAALIFHELLYGTTGLKNSDKIRRVVGLMFGDAATQDKSDQLTPSIVYRSNSPSLETSVDNGKSVYFLNAVLQTSISTNYDFNLELLRKGESLFRNKVNAFCSALPGKYNSFPVQTNYALVKRRYSIQPFSPEKVADDFVETLDRVELTLKNSDDCSNQLSDTLIGLLNKYKNGF